MSELHIITDGSLLIRDGIIVEVGPTRRVENLSEARTAREINAAGRVVLPGFVDSHTHVAFPGPGMGEDERATTLRHLNGSSANLLRTRVQRSLEMMVRHGTTMAGVHTGAVPDFAAESKLLRVLTALKKSPLELLPTYLSGLPADEPEGEETLERVRRRGACIASWIWDGSTADADRCTRFFEAARRFGFARRLHAAGGDASEAIAVAVYNNILGVDHLEHASANDAELLASSNVIATLLPAASYRNGGRYAPARALVDAGAAVSLATDFCPNQASTLSMQTVISLACAQLSMTAAEAIAGATINAAHALGRADQTGSLEPGKRANLVLLNTGDYRDLAHHLGTNLVYQTMRDGVFIYQEGKVATQPAEDAA